MYFSLKVKCKLDLIKWFTLSGKNSIVFFRKYTFPIILITFELELLQILEFFIGFHNFIIQ